MKMRFRKYLNIIKECYLADRQKRRRYFSRLVTILVADHSVGTLSSSRVDHVLVQQLCSVFPVRGKSLPGGGDGVGSWLVSCPAT